MTMTRLQLLEYVYSEVEALDKKPKVGDGDCVALVRHYTRMPSHRWWKEGAAVLGNTRIQKGTAIATFVRGKYPNRNHGNHAAFFLRHGSGGFWVIDQYKRVGTIVKRFIRVRGKKNDGSYLYPSDNALAFSVIEVG